jgi:hypothetical protein
MPSSRHSPVASALAVEGRGGILEEPGIVEVGAHHGAGSACLLDLQDRGNKKNAFLDKHIELDQHSDTYGMQIHLGDGLRAESDDMGRKVMHTRADDQSDQLLAPLVSPVLKTAHVPGL